MADKFDGMTGPQLAAEAAALMGWKPTEERGYYLDSSGDWHCIVDIHPMDGVKFDPANDLRHASEFGAAFQAAWPGYHFVIGVYANGLAACNINENFRHVPSWSGGNPSEATARTIAICRAWTALKASNE